MFKRIIDSWPYALALVLGLVAIGLIPMGDDSQFMGWVVLTLYILTPLLILVGGIVLGFRRGFDWVTLLVCLVVFVALFAVFSAIETGDLGMFAANVIGMPPFFIVPALVGIGVGAIVRVLSRRSWVAVVAFVVGVPVVLAGIIWLLFATGIIAPAQGY